MWLQLFQHVQSCASNTNPHTQAHMHKNTEKSVVQLVKNFACAGSAALILAHVKIAQTQTLELDTAG